MQGKPLVSVRDLKVWFPVRKGVLSSLLSKRMEFVKAVNEVSFDIMEGETLCVAGESGSGKTTLARAILQLIKPTAGSVLFDGRDVSSMDKKELRKLRCEMQIIFQDPYESLDPRMTVFDLLAEPLEVNRIVHARKQKEERVYKVLDAVRLVPPKDFARRFPHELSGGQRQRVVVARALILQPRFMVADEPVSMLDASVRTEILNLLFDLRSKYNLTYMYITHDLAQARYVGDRLIILYLGKIMEKGPVEEVIKDPIHPYTKALISHVPVPDPTLKRERIRVKGETPSPIDIPSGCRFHTRCPYMKEICREKEPKLEAHGSRYSACHFFK